MLSLYHIALGLLPLVGPTAIAVIAAALTVAQLKDLKMIRDSNETPFSTGLQPTRLIVQGAKGFSYLANRLRELQSALGYRYNTNLAEHLLRYHVDIRDSLYDLPSHHLLDVTYGSVAAITAALIRQIPEIIFVEPDVDLRLSMPFNEDSVHFPIYRGSILRSKKSIGSGVKVAVVDSGAEHGTPIAGFFDLVDQNNANLKPGPAHLDYSGHGTAMATIIKTIAPGAEVYVVRVCKQSTRFKLWDLLSGIGTAAIAVDADIVNLSLGCRDLGGPCMVCGGNSPSRSASLENFIAAIHSRSVAGRPVFVAASGNADPTIPNDDTSGFEWPACYDSVLAVGALTENSNNNLFGRSSFSKTGTNKISNRYAMCPGGETLAGATENVGEVQYKDASGHTAKDPVTGTSPATAFAAAILACYDEYGSTKPRPLTGDDLLALAFNDCKQDLDPSYKTSEHGRGRLVFDP